MRKIENQRRFPRVECMEKSRFKLLSIDGVDLTLLSGYTIGMKIINLSIGGACITCEGSARALVAKVGSMIELKVPFEDSSITVKGKVVWWNKTKNGVNAGISFETLSEPYSGKLKSFLNI